MGTANGTELGELIGRTDGGSLHVQATALEVTYIDAVRAKSNSAPK